MALKTQPRKQHSQVVKSLHELGSLTSPPTPASADHVPTADVKDVELKALDANSAHVVVTLRSEEVTAVAVAPTNFTAASAAPVSQPVLETKEITMTATTTAPVTSATPTTPAAAPVAAPVAAPAPTSAVSAVPVAANPAARFGFAPDFSFLQNPDVLNKTVHDLTGGLNTVNDRVDSLEDRMRRIEANGSGLSGRIVTTEDNSFEAIAYKVGTAALVGGAVYTGVKLASWLLDSPAPTGE